MEIKELILYAPEDWPNRTGWNELMIRSFEEQGKNQFYTDQRGFLYDLSSGRPVLVTELRR